MPEEPKILYHYTSMATLLKILQGVEATGKLTLLGTHIKYLNDKAEFSTAINIIIDAIKEYENKQGVELEKRFSDIIDESVLNRLARLDTQPPFVTCFSEEPDSLPMWTHYAEKGQGVAIGIKQIDNWIPENDQKNFAWGTCSYDKEDFSKNLIESFIPNLFKNLNLFPNKEFYLETDFSDLPKYLSIIKHPGYSYEKEVRLIKLCFCEKSKRRNTEYEIKFREVNGLLISYIEHQFPKEILSEIIIGPSIDPLLSRKSIYMCLLRSGFSSSTREANYVAIKESQIPYRLL